MRRSLVPFRFRWCFGWSGRLGGVAGWVVERVVGDGVALLANPFTNFLDGRASDDGRRWAIVIVGFVGCAGEFVGFVVGFEHPKFALKSALSVVFVAQHEVLHFDVVGCDCKGGFAIDGDDEIIELALAAEAVPLGLGGAKDEVGFEGVGARFVGIFPTGFEDLPTVWGFLGKDESGGAGAVLESVLGGSRFAFGGGWTGAAGVTFFAFGIRRIGIFGFIDGRLGGRIIEDVFVRIHISELSVEDGRAGRAEKNEVSDGGDGR